MDRLSHQWFKMERSCVSVQIHHSFEWCLQTSSELYRLRPIQNGRHFPDGIFKRIFVDENIWISTEISLKFVPEGPIKNFPALIQIMAWRRSCDRPLSDAMMVRSATHLRVTRPQWVTDIQNCVWKCHLQNNNPFVQTSGWTLRRCVQLVVIRRMDLLHPHPGT